jgi:iron complex outermembrane receptor protein
MKTRLGVTLFILMLSCISVAQQRNELSGKIIDAKSNPVSKASVSILNTNMGAITDANGVFVIRNISPGNYTVQVSAIGYATTNRQVNLTKGLPQTLDVQLNVSLTQLDAVTVTAQKKEEVLQNTPLSVTAISSRQVEEYRLWNSRDITAIVPNLYSADPGDKRNVTSIRGITTTSYDPAVVTYIDGVNQFGLDTYIAQLFDVERIEVLRGPQGTLYGRNAMGGVINIITRQPTNVTTGFAEASVGNYGQQRYGLGLRTPLIQNKLFGGISGVYEKTDGFYTNEYNNTSFDKQHSVTGNYYLRFLPNAGWSITLNAKNHLNRNNGPFSLINGVDEALANPFKLNQNATTEIIDNVFNGSLSVNHFNRHFNFSSQSSYQSNYRYYKQPIDADFSPLDAVTIINNYGSRWNNIKVITQEFKLSSSADNISPYNWTIGSYLFHQNSPNKQATHFGEDAGMLGVPDKNFSIINTTKAKTSGVAFFGQMTYSVSDKLSLIGGLRYDYEKKKYSILGEYQKDPNPMPIFETQPDTSASASFNAFSPKFGLTYKASEKTNLFTTYSRGYRTGGLTQLSSDPSQPPLYPYKPEYSNNIEAGIKNSFSDNRFRLNIALFLTRVTDAQVPTLILPDAITVTKNAGELTSKGIEIEFAATPIQGLQVDYNFGFTDAEYQTLKLSQNGSSVDLKGKKQIFTPNYTSMLALQYSYGIGTKQNISLVVRGEWMLIGKQYFDLANTIRQNPYDLLNTRFGIAAKNFELMFWGRNLSDEKYISYAYDFGAVHLGNPKTYGITLTGRF